MELKKLFTPFKINQCTIKNRFVVPAMVTNYCDENGNVTDRFIKYHEEKAKGGWGLIITEDYGINPNGVGYSNCVRLYDKKQVPTNQKLTAAVHKHGAKIFAQVFHPGRQTNSKVNGGVQPVASGCLPDPFNQEVPHQLTIPEIHQIVRQFGNTAKLLKESGFDGIELHLAHGYLLAGFLSTRQNKRTDEYGGCLSNRLRIVHEIYHEIRQNVGVDFPLTARISLTEDSVDGRKMAETMAIVHDLEKLGFDGLHLSNGEYVDGAPEVISSHFTAKGYNFTNAKRVRQTTHIPLIVANGIQDPMLAEDVLDEDIADFVGMARASLADPYLPKKTAEGKFADINQCIRCLQGCEGGLLQGGSITCMVNPRVGREGEYDFKPVAAKKVLIIGGGPAGLEAAITAKRRGHDVTLWEASNQFGGEFIPAAYPPAKGELAQMIAFLVRQLDIRHVHYELNH
ncbi:MAG: NAD(P)-binding protein, partial [Limosilactobacillus sp.]